MAKYELTSEDITAIMAAFDRFCEAVDVIDNLYSNMRRETEILDSEPETGEGGGEGNA